MTPLVTIFRDKNLVAFLRWFWQVKFFIVKRLLHSFIPIKLRFFPQIQQINLRCKGTFQLPGLWTAVADKRGQILARTRVDDKFYIRLLDKLGSEISSEFVSKCHHILGCLTAHPTDAGFVLETCSMCQVVRSYNIQTGQCSIAYKYFEPCTICHGPIGSILASGPDHLELSILKWDKEHHELRTDKSLYLGDMLHQICYSELFDMLLVVTYKQNEIKALKLESEAATSKFSDPIWKLYGVVGRSCDPTRRHNQ